MVRRTYAWKIRKILEGVPADVRTGTTAALPDVATNLVKTGQQRYLRVFYTQQVEACFEKPAEKLWAS